MASNSSKETAGGVVLLVSAVTALIWANLDFASFSNLRDFELGIPAFHLSLGEWSADGLLAIFFFLVGLELKHELVEGSLRDRAVAAVPIAAAIGGMVVPALIFLAFNAGQSTMIGWGIPMATDIAFTLAVLALVGKKLPIQVRIFLLTLAVVDDLGAILVIAIFYTATIHLLPLAVALLALLVFGLLQRANVRGWYFYLPIAAVAWAALHESGIHATIAGVAMGLLMNTKNLTRATNRVQPISSWFAVPVFAFFAAGVSVQGFTLETFTTSPVSIGILFGLVLGKPIGIVGTSWLVTKLTPARLSSKLSWWDISSVGVLAGVGFTVSLLINELAFKHVPAVESLGTLSVLVSSTLAAIIAIVALAFRNRAYSR